MFETRREEDENETWEKEKNINHILSKCSFKQDQIRQDRNESRIIRIKHV